MMRIPYVIDNVEQRPADESVALFRAITVSRPWGQAGVTMGAVRECIALVLRAARRRERGEAVLPALRIAEDARPYALIRCR